MGIVACAASTNDTSSVNFSSGSKYTEVGSSDIMVFDRIAVITGWALTAITASTGTEVVQLIHYNPNLDSETVISVNNLISPAKINTGTIANYIIPAGHGLLAKITQANSSEQLSLTVHYQS